MNKKIFILVPVFEAGLSTTEYVVEYLKCVKNCKKVRTDFFNPLTSVISNPSVLCDETIWNILATMFRGYDLLQNHTSQDSLYDIFRCDHEESKSIVKQLTGFMLYRTAKPLAEKIAASDIGCLLTKTRSMDYLYLILSMIWVPVVVECNHNAGKRTPQLQKFNTLSQAAFEMVTLHNVRLKRNSTMKVWNLKREFHKWAFDVLSGKPFEDHPEVGPTNNWSIFSDFANDVAVQLLDRNLIQDQEPSPSTIEFVNVDELEVNNRFLHFYHHH